MVELILKNILEFKEFICLSGIVTILFAIIMPLMIQRFDYRQGKQSLLFLLYQLDRKGILMIAISILEFIFVVSAIVFQKDLTIAYGIVFIMMAGILIICQMNIKAILMEVMNTLLIFITLVLGNIMFRYLQEIQFDVSVMIIYVTLNIFILLYSFYVCIQHMMGCLKKG
ncbi:MAG: hypothetical protein K2P09_02580 [Erysipelotrichales bacterium]|nr:hypothetical protein [Erysipelotrichales bacterium]